MGSPSSWAATWRYKVKNLQSEIFRHNVDINYSQISVIWMSIIRNYWILEDDGQSRLFSPLSIAIKLPIFGILIFRKIKFFKEICQFWLRKLLLNYPSRFEVLIANNVTHGDHDLFLWHIVQYIPSCKVSNRCKSWTWSVSPKKRKKYWIPGRPLHIHEIEKLVPGLN